MMDATAARTVLRWALDDRVFPAVAVEVGTHDAVLWAEALGTLSYAEGSPRASLETVFDLASLTKVIVTATVAARLVGNGRLDLDEPVAHRLREWTGDDRASVTVRDLLEHASGLPGWRPLYSAGRGPEAMLRAICREPLEYAPRTKCVYSDLGFILLGVLLERAAGSPLDRQFAHAAADAFPGAALSFAPPASWLPRLAPTKLSDERGTLAPGDVDDTNAWALGGVAGHAGLFGTAPAVGAFARAVLGTLRGGDGPGVLCRRSTLGRFLQRSAVPGSSRALAWDTMLPTSSCGTRLSPSAFGHTGFTGTSLWIDPARGIYVVLLSNRVHPRAEDNDAIQAVRRAFHDAVVDGLAT
jgi:CubicO group peptidase (beta-lactamase class C family)